MSKIKYVPLHRPYFDKKEEKEVLDTLRSGWLTTARKTSQFEDEFARYVGSKYAVALNSCTAALHLSLICAGIKPDDEVIVSPFTFAATVNTIIHTGAKPVFVDIEPDTLNIDHTKIKLKISGNTRAIIAVHYGGNACRLDEIFEIARLNKLEVIEDAAHAVAAEYKGRKIGSISDFSCFSFYANKNITTGEGGMLTTNNEIIAERAKRLSLHGLSADAWARFDKKGLPLYEIVEPGFKYNMPDIMAAIGLHQLEKLNMLQKKREKIVQIYNENLNKIKEIDILKPPEYSKSSNYIYVIKLKLDMLSKNRNEVIGMLKDEGVGVSVHYNSVHLHKYYRDKYNIEDNDFPEAKKASESVLTLPLYPTMTDKEVFFVIEKVEKVIAKCRI